MKQLDKIEFDQLHQSLRAVIEDEFMYDFYRAPHPDGPDVVWHIAWNDLRKRAAIVRASASPRVRVAWLDVPSPQDLMSDCPAE